MDRPEDPRAVVDAFAKEPQIDWKEPEFDASHPERFDRFMAAHRKWMLHLFEQQFGEPVKLER